MGGWFKLNFDNSVHGQKAAAEFVVRNDIASLIGAISISGNSSSLLETKIRDYVKLLFGLLSYLGHQLSWKVMHREFSPNS